MDPHEDDSDHPPPASPGSTIADPDVEQEISRPSTGRGTTRADPRTSLQHVLGRDASSPPAESDTTPPFEQPGLSERNEPPSRRRPPLSTPDQADRRPSAPTATWSLAGASYPGRPVPAVATASSSVFSASKMKIIKKKDGEPLWRRDIQHDFLRFIFEDDAPVFTNYYDRTKRCTFADIYVDAMARSSKSSKILRDKLLSDRAAAVNMAMVCLLVNVGRMNTTLNFFPEMRAQLRTYHAIPCLQVHQDSNTYKQLQDAPRLKSILKGACEDQQELTTFEKLKQLPRPRANPVSLIFMLAQYAPKLTEMHFSRHVDFFDLFTQDMLSSATRANAFLWLMWWYLESDFTAQDAKCNPFGAGHGPEVDGIPQKLPNPKRLTGAEALGENLDTEDEVNFGNAKREERRKIIEQDIPAVAATAKRGRKGTNSIGLSDDGIGSPTHNTFGPLPPKAILVRAAPRPRVRKRAMAPTPAAAEVEENVVQIASDTDRTQSASPEIETPVVEKPDPPPSSTRRTKPRTRPEREPPRPIAVRLNTSLDHHVSESHHNQQMIEHSSPAPSLPGGPLSSIDLYHTPSTTTHPHSHSHSRRSRPLTQHQIALNQNRKDRVSHILRQRRLESYKQSRRKREKEGSFLRFYRRHDKMIDPFENSEEEPILGNLGQNNKTNGPFRDRGLGGLVPLDDEEDDYGEEVAAYAAAIRRSSRRLTRREAAREKEKEEKEKEKDGKRNVGKSGRRKSGVAANRMGSVSVGVGGEGVAGGSVNGRKGSQNGIGIGKGGENGKDAKDQGKGKGRARGSVNGGVKSEDVRMVEDDDEGMMDDDEGEEGDEDDDDEEAELDDMDRELLGLADDDEEDEDGDGHGQSVGVKGAVNGNGGNGKGKGKGRGAEIGNSNGDGNRDEEVEIDTDASLLEEDNQDEEDEMDVD